MPVTLALVQALLLLLAACSSHHPVPYPTLFNLKANPVYDELAREFSLPIESEMLPKILRDRSKKSDEIHPNAQGYRELAEALAKLLRDAGAI
jgi:acyl-CoA thioesterase-1